MPQRRGRASACMIGETVRRKGRSIRQFQASRGSMPQRGRRLDAPARVAAGCLSAGVGWMPQRGSQLDASAREASVRVHDRGDRAAEGPIYSPVPGFTRLDASARQAAGCPSAAGGGMPQRERRLDASAREASARMHDRGDRAAEGPIYSPVPGFTRLDASAREAAGCLSAGGLDGSAREATEGLSRVLDLGELASVAGYGGQAQ
jgi:hypothetical protein